jgi:hypothetical protein
MRILRYLWAAPASFVGLALGLLALAAGGRARRVEGTLEISAGAVGRRIARAPAVLNFAAITFGHVILGQDEAMLAGCRAHERVHVRQYERWGVLFFPLYAASSLWQLARGRDWYRDNHFEVEARAACQASGSNPPARPAARP